MDYKKLITSTLIVTLAALLSLTILSFRTKEGDGEALVRLKSDNLKAPDIEYPSKDIAGRKIPKFDYVVVFPDCTSCSDFRSKSATFMDSNPEKFFLILTPDLKGIDKLLNRNRYFVVQYDKLSIYAEIMPGMYKR